MTVEKPKPIYLVAEPRDPFCWNCERCGADISDDPKAGAQVEDIEKEKHIERREIAHLCGNCMSN
jgi:hypothetical protein